MRVLLPVIYSGECSEEKLRGERGRGKQDRNGRRRARGDKTPGLALQRAAPATKPLQFSRVGR